MKHLNTYENKSFNIKPMSSYITEYIIKKKLEKPIDSEDHYEYFPKTTEELVENIEELLNRDIYDLNCIDTSEITDMSYLFKKYANNVTNKIDVSGWNVSNVTNMKSMFYNCKEFNCDLSNWNVSKVINMNNMFCNCYKFNCDLSKWNVSNVTDMSSMFYICESFEGKGLENWDVSKTIWMNIMFYKCKNLNCDLSKWDVHNVKTMEYMFTWCDNFVGKGLENWDVSNVENMSYMFCNCYNFNSDLSNWKIDKCEDFNRIFANCKNFNFEYVESWGKHIKTHANKDNMFYGMKNKPSWYEE